MKARRFCLPVAFALVVLVGPARATKMYPASQDFEPDIEVTIPAQRPVSHVVIWLGIGVALGLGLALTMRSLFLPNPAAHRSAG